MTSREYAERRYREALAQFAVGGNRYNALEDKEIDPVYWGAAAGYSVEDIIDDAHAAGATGEHDRSADIRNLYPKKKQRADAWIAQTEAEGAVGSSPARRPAVGRGVKAPAAPAAEVGLVRWLIAEGFDIDDMEKLRRLAPVYVCPDDDALALRVSTEWQLLELFAPEEYVFMRPGKASAVKARLGENLRPLKEWFDTPMSKTLGGAVEVVCVNPLTGRQGARGSYGTRDCVAAYRHMVMEFDRMSLADQCRFWAGVIRRNALPLACLVYSGNKSIHGAVRIFAKTAEEYRDLADAIAARYAVDANPDADPDADFSKHPEKHPEYYRLDVQALRNPLVCVRLAGVVRKDTDKKQTLLYAAPQWFDRDFQAKLNPAPAAERIGETDEANVPDEGQGEAEAAEAVEVGEDQAAAPAALPTARTESGGAFVRRCAECAVRADCKEAFGKYWGDKSHGGVGCDYPLKGRGEARREVADLKREAALDRLKRKHPAR